MIRIVVFALLVVGLIGFAAVGYVYTHPAPAEVAGGTPAPAEAPRMAGMLVAAHALRAGTFLKADDITSKEVDARERPPGAAPDTPLARQQMDGAMLRRSVAEGLAVLPADMLRTGDHGFLAAVIEPGMRAMTIGVNEVASEWALIWPGDRVDLILTQEFKDAGTSPRLGMAAETVLRDVRVVAVDKQLMQGEMPDDPAPKGLRTLTVEVSGEQAARLSLALRLGRLGIALRSAAKGPGGDAEYGPQVMWSGDVAHSLDKAKSAPDLATVRLFRGAEEGKEFKF